MMDSANELKNLLEEVKNPEIKQKLMSSLFGFFNIAKTQKYSISPPVGDEKKIKDIVCAITEKKIQDIFFISLKEPIEKPIWMNERGYKELISKTSFFDSLEYLDEIMISESIYRILSSQVNRNSNLDAIKCDKIAKVTGTFMFNVLQMKCFEQIPFNNFSKTTEMIKNFLNISICFAFTDNSEVLEKFYPWIKFIFANPPVGIRNKTAFFLSE